MHISNGSAYNIKNETERNKKRFKKIQKNGIKLQELHII